MFDNKDSGKAFDEAISKANFLLDGVEERIADAEDVLKASDTAGAAYDRLHYATESLNTLRNEIAWAKHEAHVNVLAKAFSTARWHANELLKALRECEAESKAPETAKYIAAALEFAIASDRATNCAVDTTTNNEEDTRLA